MYEFKKDLRTVEIKLGDERLKININPSNIVDQVNRTYNSITRLQGELFSEDKNREKEYEAFGNLVLQLVSLIFGEHSEKYVRFYDGNYTSLMVNLVGFVDEIIMPMLEDFKNEQNEILKKDYFNHKRRKK